jgi:hypothetical protein
MKKIPCKDCLCFPLCKGQVIISENLHGGKCVDFIILDKKCELFSKWYRSAECFKNGGSEIRDCFDISTSTWLIGAWAMKE